MPSILAAHELRPGQTAYELPHTHHLVGLEEQPHARGFAYVISDRLTRRHVVLTQRLPKAHEFLAKVYEEDPPCMASLYEAATGRVRSGLHHRRWRVLRVPIDEAPQEFERERRAGYEHPVVLAQCKDQLHLVAAT